MSELKPWTVMADSVVITDGEGHSQRLLGHWNDSFYLRLRAVGTPGREGVNVIKGAQ